MSNINWTDVETAAEEAAGNWRKFSCFAWHRGYHLEDADRWAIFYTSVRDAGLLEQSNHSQIEKLLAPFTEGDDPEVVAESHSHWAVGYLDGFSIRVFDNQGGITAAFKEFCCIKAKLADYPILNEEDYSEREYAATLENYASEMWAMRKELPEGWEAEVYSWFSDNGYDRFIENRDDQGGYAPRENITEALQDLGLLPSVVVEEPR
jgi:hypothetical protein